MAEGAECSGGGQKKTEARELADMTSHWHLTPSNERSQSSWKHHCQGYHWSLQSSVPSGVSVSVRSKGCGAMIRPAEQQKASQGLLSETVRPEKLEVEWMDLEEGNHIGARHRWHWE